jgi:hypothetical protein
MLFNSQYHKISSLIPLAQEKKRKRKRKRKGNSSITSGLFGQ